MWFFSIHARENPNLVFNYIIKFLQFQRERVERKEIVGATLKNFVKPLRLICEMSDIPIPWKKITQGLPKVKRYADDGAPTIKDWVKNTTVIDLLVAFLTSLLFWDRRCHFLPTQGSFIFNRLHWPHLSWKRSNFIVSVLWWSIATLHWMFGMELYILAGTVLSIKIENRIWLPYYSEIFNYVEIDSTFYNIPSELMAREWNRRTPDNFRFTAKFPKIITHEKI